MTQKKRPRGRPRDPGKARAVLDAAWALFLQRGVAAVPVEAIAASARVSKATVYACYPDKAAIFRAAVLREMEQIEASQGLALATGADASLRDTLRAFGEGIMTFLASAPAIGFYNALSTELRLHPQLARAFWDLGPGRTRANLAAILSAAHARGELAISHPVEAAEALFGMWQGFSNLQLALDLAPADRRAWIAGRVDRGVELFMRAHQPGAPSLPTRPPEARRRRPRATARR